MLDTGRKNAKILRCVVSFVHVDVMDDFTLDQTATESLFSYDNVFIDIAVRVCSWMFGNINTLIAVDDRAPTLPTARMLSTAPYIPLSQSFFARPNPLRLVMLGNLPFRFVGNGMAPYFRKKTLPLLFRPFRQIALMAWNKAKRLTANISVFRIMRLRWRCELTTTAFAQTIQVSNLQTVSMYINKYTIGLLVLQSDKGVTA